MRPEGKEACCSCPLCSRPPAVWQGQGTCGVGWGSATTCVSVCGAPFTWDTDPLSPWLIRITKQQSPSDALYSAGTPQLPLPHHSVSRGSRPPQCRLVLPPLGSLDSVHPTPYSCLPTSPSPTSDWEAGTPQIHCCIHMSNPKQVLNTFLLHG